MSGALSRTLEAVGRNLERGILDAERELADARPVTASYVELNVPTPRLSRSPDPIGSSTPRH